MTLFEYLAVANSIILSFAVVRLLDTLPAAFDPNRRYWTHCSFLVVGLWACAQYWWVNWSFAEVASWTYPKFLVYLLPPAVLYSMARALASPQPHAVECFREYFGRIHQRLFALLCAYFVALVLGGWIISGIPLTHPLRAFQVVALIAAASGIFVTSARYHAMLAAFFLLLLALFTFRIFSEPAPLTALR